MPTSHKNSLVDSHIIGTKTIVSGANRKSRQRSRSSPVRSELNHNETEMINQKKYKRSPSVSPSKIHLTKAPFDLEQEESIYYNSEESNLQYSETAYFSVKPPIMPLHLVRVQSSIQQSGAQSSSSAIIRTAHSKWQFSQESHKIVISLLNDLFENSTNGHKGHTVRQNVGLNPHHIRTVDGKKRESMSKKAVSTSEMRKHNIGRKEINKQVRYHPVEYRNIAVQAYAEFTPSDKHTAYGVKQQKPEEWLGGVRALRDSHVRLVLKQLRHIDRLNRTLDRAPLTTPLLPVIQS